METFLHLLSLLILPYHDQPKAAAFPAVSASPDVIELTSASPPAAVTLEDGRYAWGAVDVEAEAPVASVELTPASPPAAVTLEDGRWAWGAVDLEAETSEAGAGVFETKFPFLTGAFISASTDVIELTPASSPAAVTLEDGRWSWGEVVGH